MPIYEYNCPEHGSFELIQSIHDDSKTVGCRFIGCKELCERQISTGTNFELKGRGWADDGYVQGLKDYDPAGGEY